MRKTVSQSFLMAGAQVAKLLEILSARYFNTGRFLYEIYSELLKLKHSFWKIILSKRNYPKK